MKSMKVFTFLLSMMVAFVANAQKTVAVDKIPSSTEEFIQLRNDISKTPEGGAVAFIVAAIKYSQDPTMGREWAIVQTDKSQLKAVSSGGYKGFDLSMSNDYVLKQVDMKKYIPYSYVKGTTNANGYAIGSGPYKFQITRTQETDGGKYMKVFVACTGADTPRPITLIKNDAGVWKCVEYSSIFVGVRPPVVKSKGAEEGDF